MEETRKTESDRQPAAVAERLVTQHSVQMLMMVQPCIVSAGSWTIPLGNYANLDCRTVPPRTCSTSFWFSPVLSRTPYYDRRQFPVCAHNRFENPPQYVTDNEHVTSPWCRLLWSWRER